MFLKFDIVELNGSLVKYRGCVSIRKLTEKVVEYCNLYCQQIRKSYI